MKTVKTLRFGQVSLIFALLLPCAVCFAQKLKTVAMHIIIKITPQWWRGRRAVALLVIALSVGIITIPTRAQTPRLEVQLGHQEDGAILSVAFSHNGRYVITAGSGYSACLWETATGRQIRQFSGHTKDLMSACFSPDGKQIATGSYDGTARVWDTSTGKMLRKFSGHERWVPSVEFSANGKQLLTCSESAVRLWDIATNKQLLRRNPSSTGETIVYSAFSERPNLYLYAFFLRDAKTIVTGGSYVITQFWHLAKRGETWSAKPFRSLGGSDLRLACSRDGKYVATTRGNYVQLYSGTTGKLLHKLWHSQRPIAVALSPDGKYIATGGFDKTLRFWLTSTGKMQKQSLAHADVIVDAEFSDDGKYLLTGSNNSSARLVNVSTKKEEQRFVGYAKNVYYAALSPNSQSILIGADKVAYIWNTTKGKPILRLDGHEGRIIKAVFSTDSKSVITGSDVESQRDQELMPYGEKDALARLWDLATGEEQKKFGPHRLQVNTLSLSIDGKYLLTGGDDETARLWDIGTGRQVRKFIQPDTSISVLTADYSRDGKYVLTGSNNFNDYTALLWDTASGRSLRRFRGHSGEVTSVAFSHDTRQVLTGSKDTTICIWNSQSAKRKQQFLGHSGAITTAVFAPDDKKVLSASKDGTARLWDANTGKIILSLRNDAAVNSAVFSTDGKLILTSSEDGFSRLWSASSGKLLCSVIDFRDGDWAVVAPDGRFDTNNLEGTKGLSWIMPDDPFKPLPLEIFMRQYYEPRLLSRIIAREKLPPLPSIAGINRVQPRVFVAEPKAEPGAPDEVSIQVTVARGRSTFGLNNAITKTSGQRKDGTQSSGVHDLRLFRDGQMVGYQAGEVKLHTDGKQIVTFHHIKLPRRADTKQVEFSAYAFNVDLVKSDTYRRTFDLPPSLVPQKGRAYLINVGVNDSQLPRLKLRFAVNDARRMQETLLDKLRAHGEEYTEIAPIALLSDSAASGQSAVNTATKAHVQAVLHALSGQTTPVDAVLLAQVAGADKLSKATPNDLLLISFSSHGDADDKGNFYLLPQDVGTSDDIEQIRKHSISSEELMRWLQDVDADEMVMIVDACHSSAAVEGEGFKPGPMGSRGLGQLAYDKGMRILAASQAADVALENQNLQQGLLSYALVRQGLNEGKADYLPIDRKIMLDEWLGFGVQGVPLLHEGIRNGKFKGKQLSKGSLEDEARQPPSLQQPSLFDFKRKRRELLLVGSEATGAAGTK